MTAHKVKPLSRIECARLGGLKLSQDRAKMSALGKVGGKATASIPGHMKRAGRLGHDARGHK